MTLPDALPGTLDPAEVDAVVARALDEDLRDGPDATTAGVRARRAPSRWGSSAPAPAGTLAGVGVAVRVLERVCGPDLEVLDARADGDRLAPGDVALAVRAPLRTLLTAERTALNLLGQLSGVATATAAWVDAVDGHPRPHPRHPQDRARGCGRCRSTPCAAAAGSTTGCRSATRS